ncbi:hypothetical protein GCM10025772_12140 [Ferrimonas gelatinilytica]|uniref:Uncharacterized protein n=2 Tax=Ferrimonas gelatinilytica TaxID=1255257 RepID=A0ABP9RZS7_9GAMM
MGHLNEEEQYEINTVLTGRVNGYETDLTVVQWALLGPTYWRNYVSVFTYQKVELDTKGVPGLVDNIQLKNGIISLNVKLKGPDDPRCCPSVIGESRFHIVGNELVALP